MSTDRAVVLLEEGRVVRLFGERSSDSGERAEARGFLRDVRLQVDDPDGLEAIRARIDPELEHRLREPFSAIATIAGVLRHQVNEQQADQIDAVATAAAEADAFVVDLLNFVRAGVGGVVAVRRSIDLKVVCERAVDAISARYPHRQMTFTSDRHVDGHWDPEGIESLLSKLVLNAILHGPPVPPVAISVRGLGEAAVIEVWNGGAIADPEVRAHLFEPFVSRARFGRRRRLGLGLYMAREIARAHGGSIEFQSDEQSGTTFRVTLPRS